MKKKKLKIQRKKLLTIIAIFLTIISIVVVTLNINKKEKFEITPEIAKSREYDKVKPNDEKTNSNYVTFDAFFLKDLDGDGIADAIRGTCNEIGKEDTLYMELKTLSNGYLKDGEITINSQNFYFKTTIVKDNEIADNYISSNTKTLKLKDIQNGVQKMIVGQVRSVDSEVLGNNINKYSQKGSVTFKGTHVDDDGVTETPIEKTIEFDVDWYGKANASIYNTNVTQTVNELSELVSEENLSLSFDIQTRETTNQLLLKKSYLEGKIPNLNGYSPKSVTVTGLNVTYEYDSETQTFTAAREANVSSTGDITATANTGVTGNTKYNNYRINVIYPAEAYTEHSTEDIELIVPTKTYYEAYNNPSEQFQNPYISNTASSTVVATWKKYAGEVFSYNINIGRRVTNPYDRYVISKEKPYKIYNALSEEESEDRYTVTWEAYTGTKSTGQKLIMKETKTGQSQATDMFIKTDGTTESMEDLTTNVGISFKGAQNLLGNDGWIKVYNDETNELLATFTKDNWNTQDIYYYENPVKHIRVETSEVNDKASLYIYNEKELDDKTITDKYTLAQFEELQYIRSNLAVQIGETSSSTLKSAYYEAPLSVAKLRQISTVNVSTQVTQNEKITIETECSYFNEQKWKNGSFLLKLPKNIEELKINSVTTSDSLVKILGYDAYEEGENYFIKILTENDQELVYNIEVDCDITLDPRITDRSDVIELYATNEQAIKYYKTATDIYDVNGNLNVTEEVNYATTPINIVSPKSLLTNQIASNYDTKGSVTIAPRVAKTDKNQRKATVEVNVTNNYSNKISDVIIQGVIPFEGNKYIIGNSDLNSTFSTYITKGINVPEGLQQNVTIYYSTQPTPSSDITDSVNGWTLEGNVTDWTKIKTYMIVLGDYELAVGEQQTFSYEINLPEGIEYNEVSYSHHAIYFSLNTTAGKYPTLTSASKLGFMIAKQYDFELEKYQQNTSKTLEGITFSVKEEGANESSIKVTNQNGKISLSGLFAERTYLITELKTTNDYVKIEDPIRLYTYTDDADNLFIEFKNADGTTIQQPSCIKNAQIIKEEDKDYMLKMQIEDEVKAKLIITKSDESSSALKSIKFRLSGKGKGGQDGVILTTNSNGQIMASGLFLNETYTLKETRADGYYIIENEIKFKITDAGNGNFNLNILEGSDSVGNSSITTVNEIPTINIDLQDEKIPTYNLQLKKYEENSDTLLKGAQYLIKGDGLPTNGRVYTTDENGIINISNLYEYIEVNGNPKGGVTGEYTIKEIYAPEGYAVDATEIKIRAQRNSSGELELQILSGEEKIKTVDGNKVYGVQDPKSTTPTATISVEDSRIFTLYKEDGETAERLPDSKFLIYSLDDDRNVVDFAKDISGNYVGILNDENKYEITTDELGKISLNLPEGLYKIVESKAPEGYEISNKEYFFGIGSSKQREIEFGINWKAQISGNKWNKINSTYTTKDGGLIAAGYMYESTTTPKLVSNGQKDALIIKYDNSGEVQWVKNYGGSEDEEFTKIVQTKDGGYAVVGTTSSSDFSIGTTRGLQDAILLKLDSTGNIVWSKIMGGTQEDTMYSVIEDSNGNIIVTGGSYSSPIYITDTQTITNSGEMDGFIASFTSSGTYKWHQGINSTLDAQVTGITETSQGYVAVANFRGKLTIGGNSLTASSSSQDGIVIGYDSSGNYQWHQLIAGTANEQLVGVITTTDGNALVYGNYASSITVGSNSLETKGQFDIMLLKYTPEGTYVENSALTFGGTQDDMVSQIVETKDEGLLIGGYYYSASIDIDGDGTNDITKVNKSTGTSQYYSDGFAVKLADSSLTDTNSISFFDTISGTNYEEVKTVAEIIGTDGESKYVAAGWFDSTDVDISGETNAFKTEGNTDGFIVTYGDVVTAEEIASKQEVTINNTKKKFKITTQINTLDEDGNTVGGTITGKYGFFDKVNYIEQEHIQYVENVRYGENSTKANQIVITPNENYKITSIKINGENYAFMPDETGKVTLPIFEDVLEDKHIIVEFSNTMSSVTVNHLLWDGRQTTTPVAESQFLAGEIGSTYTTSPNIDIEYVLITNADYYGNNVPTGLDANEYYIPANASGVYTSTEQVINYYYKEKTYKLTVNHFIEGTNTPVPSSNGGTVSPIETEGHKKGDSYTTTAADNIDTKYELVSTPENYKGTIEQDTIVTYYYQIKNSAGVIVHHYIQGTTTQVPSRNGGTVADEILPTTGTAKVGDSYITVASSDVAPNYQLVGTPANATGNYEENVIEVTYYYDMVNPNISNSINKTGTASISEEDEVVSYTINYKANITDYIGQAKVNIVDTLPFEIDTSKPYQLNGGIYDEATKTITWSDYLYDIDTYNGTSEILVTKNISLVYKNIDFSKNKMVNSVIGTTTLLATNSTTSTSTTFETTYGFDTDVVVTKEWKDNNNSLGIRPESINVTLEASNATIPNSIIKTVTLKEDNNWTYTWPGMDKYNSAGELINYTVKEAALTGNLAIVYSSESKENSLNNWTITNTYHEPENNVQDIEVEKNWVDNNNSAQKRPENIIIELYQGDSTKVYQQYKLNVETETSHIFQVEKYDLKGYEIEYNVQEKEDKAGDLQFYKNTIQKTGNKYTITNRFEVESGGKTITVEKKWEDNNNVNQKRPSNIKIVIQKDAKQEVTSYIMNSQTETSHTFTLDRYDSNGDEISYIVDEEEVRYEDLKFYTKEIKQSTTDTDKYIITNTFTVPSEKISITATKEWEDNDIQSKRRPESVMIKLLNGTAEVDTAIANTTNNWQVVFNDLPKYNNSGNEINYTVDEAEVTTGDLKFYKKSINGYTIKNTFTLPSDNTKTIKAIKTWNDNNKNRLAKITLVLTGDGNTYKKTISNAQVDPTNADNWLAEFSVPIYNSNGEEIQYSLNEQEVNSGDLNYYVATVDNYTLTNTLIIEDSSITKTGPATITDLDSTLEYEINYNVSLNDSYKDNATVTIVDTLPYKIDETKPYNLDGGTYDANTKTITWTGTYDINTNSITWVNSGKEMLRSKMQVSKKISLVYQDIPIEDTNTTITNNVQGKIELATGAIDIKENTFNTTTDFKIDVTIIKNWVGDEKIGNDGTTVITGRPNEVTVQLLADGTLTRVVKLNIQNSWQSTVSNLPKYNQTTRQTIQYSLKEANVPDGYYLSNIEQNTVGGGERFTVTNSRYGKITITKVDSSNTNIKLGGAEFRLEKLKDDGTIDTEFTPITKTTSSEETSLGTATFTDLEYGKYKLTETKAPEGYHLLKESIETEVSEFNVEQDLTISDKIKPTLPATGGIGSIILIVFGTAVLGIAINRKIQREKGVRK